MQRSLDGLAGNLQLLGQFGVGCDLPLPEQLDDLRFAGSEVHKGSVLSCKLVSLILAYNYMIGHRGNRNKGAQFPHVSPP